MIESQWFTTSSKGNADVETTAKIVEQKDLPLSIVILVVTAVCFYH